MKLSKDQRTKRWIAGIVAALFIVGALSGCGGSKNYAKDSAAPSSYSMKQDAATESAANYDYGFDDYDEDRYHSYKDDREMFDSECESNTIDNLFNG